MPVVTYIEASGQTHVIDVPERRTVMEGALRQNVPGIPADCGGSCSCATCHVYIDPAWAERVGPPGEAEREMLEGAVDPRPTSRLSCQVRLTPALDGLVVHIPASQTVDQKWGA